jgi:hypothetical protein
MKRSGIGEVMKLDSPAFTPTTPAPQIAGASGIVSGTVKSGLVGTVQVGSSVRDCNTIRQETKPTTQTSRSDNAQAWLEMHARWKREAEESDARRYTETVRLWVGGRNAEEKV